MDGYLDLDGNFVDFADSKDEDEMIKKIASKVKDFSDEELEEQESEVKFLKNEPDKKQKPQSLVEDKPSIIKSIIVDSLDTDELD